jgi:hypothetical protein
VITTSPVHSPLITRQGMLCPDIFIIMPEQGACKSLRTKRRSLFSYACRDSATGSLYPISPDQSRKVLYCFHCAYRGHRCLFAPGDCARLNPSKEEGREAKRREALDRRAARLRRRGLNAAGKPLATTCWNCVHIRRTDLGYVCGEGVLLMRSRNASAMQHQEACELFRLRTEMAILEFSS